MWRLLGTLWGVLGTLLAYFGSSWARVGGFSGHWRNFSDHAWPLCAILAKTLQQPTVFEGFKGGQGALRAHFGALVDTLTGPGNTFGVLWKPLGTLWELLETLWVLFGVLWAILGAPVRKHCKTHGF